MAEEKFLNEFLMKIINTNARSLRPKLTSFIDCFKELELTFAIVSETWFCDGNALELEAENLLLGEGLRIITKNRPPGRMGYSHGGVAIISREAITKVKEIPFNNPESFEVLPIEAKVKDIKRTVYIIAVYIPPKYTAGRGRACLQHVNDIVLHIKNNCVNPYILVSGDVNQWALEDALFDYPDLSEILSPPTRGDSRIDRSFTNLGEPYEILCLPPLQTEPDLDGNRTESDHRIQYFATKVEKKPKPVWTTYTYRTCGEEGQKKFHDLLSREGWENVLRAKGSNAKAEAMQRVLDDAMDHCFPLKKVKRKDTDDPWLNDVAMKKIKKKREVYKAEGSSDRWWALRADFDRYIEGRRQKYLAKQRNKLTGPQAMKEFYKNVRNYKSPEKPKSFSVTDLRPNMSEREVAEEAAQYFNKISQEFEPLVPTDIPTTYERPLPRLTLEEVEKKIRDFKKPNSMVQGDIFPKTVTACAPFLAIPLREIFNEITRTYIWPLDWKKEYVTIIPKKTLPTDFSELRNISCTKLFSKMYESYVLQWAMEEITLKDNQYGGVKGCSTSHMLIDLWQNICSNAEDYTNTTVIAAVDYAKAFNRMSYQECLLAFKRKGASSTIMRLISTFLTNRTMTVKAGSTWSTPLPVSGGCPQGSILGVFLFNCTTDDLEDDFLASQGQEAEPALRRDPSGGESEEEEEAGPLPPITSTPGKTEPFEPDASPLGTGKYRIRDMQVVFEPRTKNIPIEYSCEGMIEYDPVKHVVIMKYVDDNVSVECLNMSDIPTTVESGKVVKIKQAAGIQNAFRSVVGNALKKGMAVNNKKTCILCVSDNLSFLPKTFIYDRDGEKIESTDKMRVLGFDFTNRPTVTAQVDSIRRRIRQRYWILRLLKRLGFNESELLSVYRSIVVPVADYTDVVYHSMMTDEQDEFLENSQVGALRCIYGYGISGRKMREKASLKTLRQRRIEHCDNFANKCLTNKFERWFPRRNNRRSGRHSEQNYEEFYARCDRLRFSPLFYMRRRLNGKQGKTYGERYRIYRET